MSAETLALMRRIDETYLEQPFYGSRQMSRHWQREGWEAGRKRVRRLMRVMGLEAMYRRPRTSVAQAGHAIYPYWLRGVEIARPHQVWSADVTYLPMPRGFLYLVAVMDWASRYVLAWRLANTLEAEFCVEALVAAGAAAGGAPEICNTDQGSPFTSEAFPGQVRALGARMSMDGRGRCLDNVFIERLWRSLKDEAVDLAAWEDGFAAERGIGEWMDFSNRRRPHSALGGRTPWEAVQGEGELPRLKGR